MRPVREQEQVRATGGCLCGRVRYTVRGPLRGILLCHCGQCRRVHSHLGAFSSAARADIDLEGAEAIVWFKSSERGRRGFCGTCGSSLFFEPAGEDAPRDRGRQPRPAERARGDRPRVCGEQSRLRAHRRRPARLRRRLGGTVKPGSATPRPHRQLAADDRHRRGEPRADPSRPLSPSSTRLNPAADRMRRLASRRACRLPSTRRSLLESEKILTI